MYHTSVPYKRLFVFFFADMVFNYVIGFVTRAPILDPQILYTLHMDTSQRMSYHIPTDNQEVSSSIMLIYLQMIETPEDKAKFERLYNKYRNLMYNIAYSLLKNEHDAEDAVHQAFVSILENLEKLSSVECPKTKAFCVIVVERKALNMIRERKKYAGSYDLELEGIEISIPDETGLPSAMARLSDRYREVLLLRFHLGYTTKEISDILDISHAATLKLIWRAKHELSALLEREDDHYEKV